jgi:uncharacterized phiE125 gp8 family phage protein
MAVTLLATIEPISLAEAKAWLLIDYDDQDSEIESLIKAARLKIEKRCGISIAMKQYAEKLSGFSDKIELSNPPVISVDSIKYLDADGAEQTVDVADYVLMQDDYVPYIFPASAWPTDIADRPDAVRITYTTGIDIEDSPPDEVPEDLKQAMRLMIGENFETRQGELLLPTRQELGVPSHGIDELLAPYVVMRL